MNNGERIKKKRNFSLPYQSTTKWIYQKFITSSSRPGEICFFYFPHYLLVSYSLTFCLIEYNLAPVAVPHLVEQTTSGSHIANLTNTSTTYFDLYTIRPGD